MENNKQMSDSVVLSKQQKSFFKKHLERIIFVYSGRIVVTFYITILLGLVIYAFFNLKEFVHYVLEARNLTGKTAMLTFIELIDMSMVAHLGVMVVKGSYNTFVSKDHMFSNENIGSGLLKVKMKTSLINIVAVSMLQQAIMVGGAAHDVEWSEIFKIGFIYIMFNIGAVVLQYVDYLHLKSECLYQHHPHEEEAKCIETPKEEETF